MKISLRKHEGAVIVLLGPILFAAAASRLAAQSSGGNTTTPIKHLVVIFQENVSFDHYFATYPNAANPPREPAFHPRPGTPTVNGLSGSLLTHNPNSFQPFRLDRSQELTCNPTPAYAAEIGAYHAGLLDRFPEYTVQTATTNPHRCGSLACRASTWLWDITTAIR